MRFFRVVVMALVGLAFGSSIAHAQGFSSGSNGSFGPINVVSGTTTINLPPDGIIHATTVTVGSAATLKFNRNSLNTPVFILATGDITIEGIVGVPGGDGTSTAEGPGGPGGFNGGVPGRFGSPPGDGQGPGGGSAGAFSRGFNDSVGGGAYGGVPTAYPSPRDGVPYGSPLLVPLVGGSGGGGAPDNGGGGGGGAILLASNTRVHIRGSVRAFGGNSSGMKGGSGGAIRIVSPIVSGDGFLWATGGSSSLDVAGDGRIRIDVVDRSAFNVSFSSSAVSVGAFMVVFPPVVPRLDIVNAAGQAIAEGTPGPVQVLLPFGSPTTQPITVQARDFTGVVPIAVVLTPERGPRTVIQTNIDMSTGNPAQVTVNTEFPENVVTHVSAWTR